MRLIVARHAETVFNKVARMQGDAIHTPLTVRGFQQAIAIGAAVKSAFDATRPLEIWMSPTDRAIQTASIAAEAIDRSIDTFHFDARLREIDVGEWGGCLVREIETDGPIICPEHKTFLIRPPGGEWYTDVAARLNEWLTELNPETDHFIVSHGVTTRVLRGLLAGGAPFSGVSLGLPLAQGSVVEIDGEIETVLHYGGGPDISTF